MDYLENLELIKRLGNEILKPRSYCYSQEMVAEYLRQYKDIEYEPMIIINKSKENLKASLFTRGQPTDICIVFMHGLGSTRLQGLNLLKELPEGYSLCVFDFSGSGKSEGDCVTYGIKEKHDICKNKAVLKILRGRYSKFILWGRSMGAVSALLYTITYNNPEDVILLVLDSPFSSFEVITKELAMRKVKVPSFMISLLLDLVKANFKRMSHDPFQIDASDCSNCRVPALFIYSESDDVVLAEHSHRIISNFKAKYDRFIILENHNAPRTRETLKKIFNSIEQTRLNGEWSNPIIVNNTGQQVRRKSIFQSTDKDINRKNRGINVVSRQKSSKHYTDNDSARKKSVYKPPGHHKNPLQPNTLQSINLQNCQYFTKSTELRKVVKKTNWSPPKRKLQGEFYMSFEDDIAYSLTEKISQKMMLSNQRYL